MSETYGNLQNILDYIHKHKADAKIYWHMTWAYQSDSSHGDFANYEKNQLTMYHAIASTVNDTVFKHESIAGVIPSGTAIQNLRTSYIGDTLTRDGYHLSYDAGRYTAALTWFAALTGLPVEDIDWMPGSCAGILSDKLEAIREAVNAALKTPLSVTESSFHSTTIPVKTLEITDADRETLQKLGYDPERFEVLDWEPTVAATTTRPQVPFWYQEQTAQPPIFPILPHHAFSQKKSCPREPSSRSMTAINTVPRAGRRFRRKTQVPQDPPM